MKKLFVLLVIASMATATSFAGNHDGDPIVKSSSKSSVKSGINIGSGGVQSNSKSSVKYGTHKSNNNFSKKRYHKILRNYKINVFWEKIF